MVAIIPVNDLPLCVTTVICSTVTTALTANNKCLASSTSFLTWLLNAGVSANAVILDTLNEHSRQRPCTTSQLVPPVIDWARQKGPGCISPHGSGIGLKKKTVQPSMFFVFFLFFFGFALDLQTAVSHTPQKTRFL